MRWILNKNVNNSSLNKQGEITKGFFFLGILVVVAALFFCCSVYYGGLRGPFILDDKANIIPAIVNELSFDSILYAANSNISGVLGRPVSAISFAISGVFSPEPLNPYWFKVHNLIIHVLCGLGIWIFTNIIFNHIRPEQRRNNYYASILVMALWLLHPLSVSTVLYVVQRMAQLSALFSIVAVCGYCYARKNYAEKPILNVLFLFVLVPVSILLGMFSKENAVTMLFLIAIIEWFIFRFKFTTSSSKVISTIFGVGVVIAPIFLGVLFFIIYSSKFLDYSGRSFTLVERIYTQIHVIPYYLQLIITPKLTDMGVFHDDFPIQHGISWLTVLFATLIIIMFVFSWKIRKKCPVIAAGVFWFFSCHAIESTILPLEMVFEHRNYLALLGVVMIGGYYASFLKRNAFVLLAAVILVVYSSTTFIRVNSWRSTEVLLFDSINNHPRSTRAHTGYGNLLLKKGVYDEGRKHIARVAELKPEDPGAYMHLVLIDCNLNMMTDPINFKKANRYIMERPVTPYVLSNIEQLVSRVAKKSCPAIIDAAQVKSVIKNGLNGVGNRNPILYLHLGRLELYDGNYESGLSNFAKAFDAVRLGLKPQVLMDLMKIQIELGHFADAKATITKARDYSMSGHNIDYYIYEMERHYNEQLAKVWENN